MSKPEYYINILVICELLYSNCIPASSDQLSCPPRMDKDEPFYFINLMVLSIEINNQSHEY